MHTYWLLSLGRGLLFATLYTGLAACYSVRPSEPFTPSTAPPPPDYSRPEHWAALPQRADAADRTPCGGVRDQQGVAPVDVFYLHPTSYYGRRRKPVKWNAALQDAAVNARTDSGAVLHQASLFNTVGRVYAPRYRQAHLHAFFSRHTEQAEPALALAYRDVLAAFEYYLAHWNDGRPFVLAAHSQGAYLGMRLLRERIEGTPLRERLVVAYLVGWPIRKDYFQTILPCTTALQTHCFCSWRTWRRDAGLKLPAQPQVVCTNPLTWSTRDGEYADRSLHLGGVLRNFCPTAPGLTDAEVRAGYLLCAKPKFPGSIFFTRRNYHIGDFNLYYFNVQKNAEERIHAFLNR